MKPPWKTLKNHETTLKKHGNQPKNLTDQPTDLHDEKNVTLLKRGPTDLLDV